MVAETDWTRVCGPIGVRTGLPVVHTVELLDWTSGGPMPSALATRLERADGL